MRRRVAAAGSSPHRGGCRLVVSGRALRRTDTNRRHGRAASAIRRNPAPPPGTTRTGFGPATRPGGTLRCGAVGSKPYITWTGGVRCIFPAVSHLLHSPDEVRAGVQLSENLRLGTLLFSLRHNPHGVLLRHRFGETVGLHPSFARLGNFRTNSDCARLIETVVCAARMHGKTSRGPPARNRRAGGPRDAEPETCSSQGGERRTNATQPVGTTAAKRATDRKKRAV